MFKLRKKLAEVEERLSALDKELNALLTILSSHDSPTNELSYEEVIDLWLNGKSQ